ncbi:aminotransferase class III-fold pyridoxal phosphate-dependent enzyme [Dongia deserti]|uniref:aminotransferase class III-fold pyridoxal phosphate-dependent enzyme n=1 Tax=Dongia deserti TaxID=2268030 RepID=UPI000E64CEF6|nr:aminotransferase class III-fold pyridoxal phosphate-dependent enzyme [Dongia deserti]
MQYTANTLENHWMPFTSNRDFKADPRLMVKAKGMHYWNHHGDKLIDASSGLFCCAAGHGRTEITEAVHAAMKEIDYTPHFQLGHPASFELARKVAKITPGDLDYVFFCNSGSESVDTALKIAMAYHTAKGEGQRTRFVSRERAYHGVNIGGVSLSGMVRNREAFGAVMPGVAHMRHTWMPENRFVRGQPDKGAELADDLQRFVDLFGSKSIAVCFVEPIAGSTGVLVPPKGYLERLRQICDKHGILLVFDEVICGFGRTGKAFAAQSFGVQPDMITMAKALTNGALPMGAVAVSEKVYHTVTSAALDGAVEFFHGYTYSAHPAACAAGIAALDIFEREGLFERAAEVSVYFLDRMFDLKGIKAVTDIRGFGMLAGIDLAPAERLGLRGYDATKRLFKRGLHIKFTGDSGICAPALVAEKRDIDEICTIFREVFSEY